MNARTCGSLFSGIGLLDFGLHLAGWEHKWLCESDEWRRSVLRKRFPGAAVFDDVRTLRGEAAADAERDGVREQPVAVAGRGGAAAAGRAGEALADAAVGGDERPDIEARLLLQRVGGGGKASPVTLIAGGFPCKGASTAGKREGFEHAETVLWHEMRRVIGEVRPRYVLVENVSNILGMAAGPGLPAGSLWGTVLADLAALGFGDIRWDCVPAAAIGAPHLRDRVFAIASADAASEGGQGAWAGRQALGRTAASGGVAVEWGDYRPAIERWEAIHGAAPEPLVRRLDDGDAKLRRVRARVDRSRLSALGDGVHVYVGWLAGEYIAGLERERVAA